MVEPQRHKGYNDKTRKAQDISNLTKKNDPFIVE
jgi:hypothetical protein